MYRFDTNGQMTMLGLDTAERGGAPPKRRPGKPDSELVSIPYFHLDLLSSPVDLFGQRHWELRSPWREGKRPLNTGAAPRRPIRVSLSGILEAYPSLKYYLSKTACLGILRRAFERGKKLPKMLAHALKIQAGLMRPDGQLTNMQMQTFVAEGMRKFESAEKEEECLSLNDQGGERMDVSVDVTATLRAGMSGHPPLVMGIQQGSAGTEKTPDPALTEEAETGGNNQQILFENHGIDARYTGPHEVAPTMSDRYGTGGNNVPLVSDMPESYCIAGNIIDREVQNGGNGLGCQPDISYTLTSADRHAVFSRQRSDEFLQNRVTATQSARQHKDATDLVCEPYQNTVGTIGYTDHKGINNQYVSEDKCIVENRRLIRRLTPLECERLQGFPDHWTDIPGASDSARYKALGNSVAIPCVDFVLRGIAYFLRKMKEEKEP